MLFKLGNDAVDSRNLVAYVVVTSAASALGRVLGYGAISALAVKGGEFRSVRLVPMKIFMSVLFVLQILVLPGWFVWLVWQRRRDERQRVSEMQLTPAGPEAATELEC